MTAVVSAVAEAAADAALAGVRAAGWDFGLELAGFDRRSALLESEAAALVALGPRGLRRNRARGIPRRTAVHWRRLGRLVEPLDAARGVLQHADDARHRRAGAHAAAIILARCLERRCVWWGWTTWEWAQVCGASSAAFRATQPLATETTVRPFVAALGYLLSGFTDFHYLGNFNRLHLAHLIFGAQAVDAATHQAAVVMQRWGYRSQTRDDGRYRLPGVLGQALLLNRSPHLADLDSAAFAAIHAHPATSSHHLPALYALQKVVADLGHCDPPVRPGRNNAPGIQGTHPSWAAWVQRWYDTSTLTPKVRAIIRTLMAKAGRWLAEQHPEITEPSQWTRATCAAWVAAIDRMNVGDYVQRRDHLHARHGAPISPRTKAHILMASRTFFRDCQEWEWFPAGSTPPGPWRCPAASPR